MNKTATEAKVLAQALVKEFAGFTEADIVLCPTFTALAAVREVIAGQPNLALGAQNLYFEKSGAYTGEISADMLVDAGCSYVILGHSERRQLFGETDEKVHKKVQVALAAKLIPIVCVGETLEQREAGETQELVCRQTRLALQGLNSEQLSRVVLAYEPVWAIGTGKVATPAQAQEVHAWIRTELLNCFGESVSKAMRIQYGGSVKPDNAAVLLGQPDVDGALVGGASLEAAGFAEIAKKGCVRA
jgi:triosephosphate isomerase